MALKIPPIDKQAHFWWGWAIAATLFPFGSWIAIFFAMLLGGIKELWDKQGHGTPDIYDFYATAFGGVVGTVVCLVLGRMANG